MNSLPRVKERARKLRRSALKRAGDLFKGLVAELEDRGFTVKAVHKDVIGGAEATLSVADKKIRYDKDLDGEPLKRLLVIAHEAGHVLLHKRLYDRLSGVEPLSPYFNTAGPALARYNRRSREEVEADAFANEFVCPSDEVFAKWLADRAVTSATLAVEYAISAEMMLSRLAEALFEEALTKAPRAQEKGGPQLDDGQREAAHHVGTPALVNAGPGTGKTATLIMRIEHLIKTLGAEPKNMLALTFSNEAAEEMRARIEAEFGIERAEEIEITTFHGFGHAALLEWESELYKEFIVLDESRQEELVFELLGEVECDGIFQLRDPLQTARDCVRQIIKLKERMIYPDALEDGIAAWEKEEPGASVKQKKSRELLAVYRAYESAKSEQNFVDFPDLINMTLGILESRPALVEALRTKFKWVMVDEYQDVSVAVAQLLGKICGPENPPWVVGDLRQAIYVFCGAAPQNITNFPIDFANAKVYELRKNYRSCDEVIDLANQLADIIGSGERRDRPLWSRGSEVTRLDGEGPAIKVVQTDSDTAEYGAVADQIEEWMKLVRPEEIAVLARRNKDVRKIAVELSRRGIKVSTPGLISSDGAAGLLACVPAFPAVGGPASVLSSVSDYVNGRRAALPRITYALGDGVDGHAVLDRVVELLSACTGAPVLDGEPEGVAKLISEIRELEECLVAVAPWGDALAMICSFLFDGSDYLRRILASEDEAKRSVSISEIISAIGWAMSYRYSHPTTPVAESRIGFAQFFRGILAAGRPALVPPYPARGAVQVMTCHASKGLEFPCVAVTGQTLSLARTHSWLPPGVENDGDDRTQADSLLFVGATRAQRSLLISFAKTPRRRLPALLEMWLEKHAVVPVTRPSTVGESDSFRFGSVWGHPTRNRRIAATALDKDWCGLKVYLQDIYGGRFPGATDALYPIFFANNRRTIEEILARYAEGVATSSDEAGEIFLARFGDEKTTAHPLYEPYRRRGIVYAAGFAAEVERLPRPAKMIDTDETYGGAIVGGLIPLRFGITAHYIDEVGGTHAIIFRPE